MLPMFPQIPRQWTHPSTWPWIIYLWLALFVADWFKPLWHWHRRNQAASWLSAQGRIESTGIDTGKRFIVSTASRTNSEVYKAEIDYFYSVAGITYAGQYKRDFYTEADALDFVRDLKGKDVAVQYKPGKPSTSTLLESTVETLLQARAPAPALELVLSLPGASGQFWVGRFLWPLITLSAVGLVVSLWIHLGAVAGRRVAPEALFWILHIGIFVVWFPAILVAKQRAGSTRRKDFWKVVLKGSPDWMRYTVYMFLIYALVNFSLFMLQIPTGGSGSDPPAIVWRGFSGHWMAFYSAALAIFYAAAREGDNRWRCVNGHSVSPNTNFCARCGQPVLHSR